MSSSESNGPLPPDLRLLRVLVPVLMLVMIGGLLAIVWLLVTRLGAAPPVLPDLPAALVLPEGARPAAVTFARDWLVVVTEGGEILLYRPQGGPPVQRLAP